MRRATRGLVTGAAAAGVVALFRPGTRANKALRRQLVHARRRLRYLEGRLEGANYRLSGRHPDTEVADTVLADRIRSSLGKLERRLDIPRVHVMVEHHVALLHGEVGRDEDASEIEHAVLGVPGVVGVESYLHAGLTPGDTRPSSGTAAHQPSPALVQLLATAEDAGVSSTAAPAVVRGVLATFADRIPAGEREHIRVHLPADVRPLLTPPRRISGTRPPRSVHDLVGRIAGTTPELPLERSQQVTVAVLRTLRELVSDEAADVAAVLPPELRALWKGAAAA